MRLRSPKRASPASMLVDLFARPSRAGSLTTAQWDALLRVARKEQVLSRLGGVLAEAPGAWESCPVEVQDMLRAAWAYPRLVQRQANWELHQVLAATDDLDCEFILLKGVGYLRAGLPLARARAFADVDLLVRECDLALVEQRLLARGWRQEVDDDYDQAYYRRWMHEIPPLRHPERPLQLDIHHRILPRTARISPDSRPLWDAAIPVGPRLRVLAPADMVLHCAAHLFYDGEIRGRFRDLLDLHLLLEHFSRGDASFWDQLTGRALDLGLGRVLFYALRYCAAFLEAGPPSAVLARTAAVAPGAPVTASMDRLVRAALLPRDIGRRPPLVSAWVLYVRSHWLRMPPGLLARHLLRKALRRLRGTAQRSRVDVADGRARPGSGGGT